MISVILGILKIIGIILLAVILCVIAVVLLVLIVPIRYGADVSAQYGMPENGGALSYDVSVRVTWLLHFLSVRIRMSNAGGFGGKVKIAGISVVRLGNEAVSGRKKADGEDSAASKDSEASAEPDYTEPDVSPFEDITDQSFYGEAQNDAAAWQERVNREDQAWETDDEPAGTGAQTDEDLFDRIERALEMAAEKISGLAQGISEKLSAISKKIEDLKYKASCIMEFIENDENIEAVGCIFKSLKDMLLHILPRKISGKLTFGLSDPANTGKALMVLGIIYPAIAEDLEITPLFSGENQAAADLGIKGHIRLGALLIEALKLVISKKFRGLIGRIMGLKKKLAQAPA